MNSKDEPAKSAAWKNIPILGDLQIMRHLQMRVRKDTFSKWIRFILKNHSKRIHAEMIW